MKDQIASALMFAEAAKAEITKIRDSVPREAPEWEMVDDAFLGIGWAVKRLTDAKNPAAAANGKPVPV